jgi:5-methylcytosine-specific restriction endonuclease McrA
LNSETHKEAQRKYREKNREKLRIAGREYYQQNKDKYQDYYTANKEHIESRKREWRLENPDKVKDYSAKTRLKREEEGKTKEYFSRPEVKAKVAARRAQWKKDNPDKVAASGHKRRYADRGSFTAEEWQELLFDCGGFCLKCGSSASIVKEHIIPLSVGGMNTIDNLQPLCQTCNGSKYKSIADYRPEWIRLKYMADQDTGNLSPKQFYTEDSLTTQANPDEETSAVRGYQTNTSNVYRPAFSSDYNSPAQPAPGVNMDQEV